jgi:hypothetical protein
MRNPVPPKRNEAKALLRVEEVLVVSGTLCVEGVTFRVIFCLKSWQVGNSLPQDVVSSKKYN